MYAHKRTTAEKTTSRNQTLVGKVTTTKDKREKRPYWDAEAIEAARKILPEGEIVTRKRLQQVSPPKARPISPSEFSTPIGSNSTQEPRRSPRLNKDQPTFLSTITRTVFSNSKDTADNITVNTSESNSSNLNASGSSYNSVVEDIPSELSERTSQQHQLDETIVVQPVFSVPTIESEKSKESNTFHSLTDGFVVIEKSTGAIPKGSRAVSPPLTTAPNTPEKELPKVDTQNQTFDKIVDYFAGKKNLRMTDTVIVFKTSINNKTFDLSASNYKEPYHEISALYHDLYTFNEKGSRSKWLKNTQTEMEDAIKGFKCVLADIKEYKRICTENGWILPCDMTIFLVRIQECRMLMMERAAALKQLEIQQIVKDKGDKDTIAKLAKVSDDYSAKNPVGSSRASSKHSSKGAKSKPRETSPQETSTENSSNSEKDTSSDGSESNSNSDSDGNDPPQRGARGGRHRNNSPNGDLARQLRQLKRQVKELSQKSVQKRKPAPMTVQPFGGDKSDYLRFKTAFKSVYEDVGLTKIELAIRLGENLKGEPKSKFGWMADEATKSTYTQMWDNLDVFYGTRERFELKKLEKFNKMPDIKVFNVATVQLLYTTLSMNWKVLKETLKEDFSKEDNHLFYPFLKKLPLVEVIRFKEMCKARRVRRTFRSFRDWLLEQHSYLSDDRDKPREAAQADRRLMLWHQDKSIADEQLDLAFLSLDQVGEELTVESGDCSISYDAAGNPTAFLEPAAGSMLLFRDGKFRKVNKLRVPAETIVGAAVKNRPPQPPFKSIRGNSNKKEKSIEFAICVFCTKQGHAVYQCETFAKASLKTKLATVKENKLCFRCLNKNHLAKDCKVKFLCDVDKCGKRHHRLLHPTQTTKSYYAIVAQQGLGSDISDCESSD